MSVGTILKLYKEIQPGILQNYSLLKILYII